jgi:hypothetical protein
VTPAIPCQFQTENPSGRSYNASAIIDYTCTDKHCGLLPLSSKNYWVYEDSIFSYGNLIRVQYDTLRYTSTRKSTDDGLIWWNASLFVGLPSLVYSNDSAFFTLSDRMFAPDIVDAKRDFIIPSGDSVKYLANFEDVAASGRSLRLHTTVTTRAGSFSDCIYFEKNARYFRKDQVFFKEGIGVLKYIQEKTVPGERELKLQQVSTLVYMHIE